MHLIDLNSFPPGGFPYYERRLNWHSPRDGIGFHLRAKQIQSLRLANPNCGLDPTLEACEHDLEQQTCERLGFNPSYCAAENDRVAVTAVAARKVAKCGGCGKRRAYKATSEPA